MRHAVRSMRCLVWIVAIATLPESALAQEVPRTVHLGTSSCEALPFEAQRLRQLLELELDLDGARVLDDPSDAITRVRYEPVPCAPGATEFALELSREGEPPRYYRADMSEIPLATVPRALALELAEALRGNLEESGEALPVAPAGALAMLERAEPIEPLSEPPMGEPPPNEPAPNEAPSSGPPSRLGVSAGLRNSPDTGAVLAGVRVLLDLPLGDGLPLALRADLGAAFGPSSHDLVLGWLDGGLTLAIWARAIPELAVRFGPRLWLGHGWAFEAEEHGATRVSRDVQFGLGVVVAGELLIAPGLELLIQGEVGTHFEGLEYTVADDRAGFLGAYWGADLALAWSL
jgi:hypothetical protein